jgi:hypothetical protein
VLAVVEEVLAHRRARVGGQELDRRGLVGRRGHDDRVVQGVVLGQGLGQLHHRRHALADRDVDADQVLVAVVDDCVDGDGCLACLTVADDQLALAAADRDHRVDRLEAGLHRLDHALALNDARGLELCGTGLGGVHVALAVERIAERIDDPAEQLLPDGDLEQAPGALDLVALGDLVPVAEEHGADVVGLEVEREAGHIVRQLEHLERHAVVQAVHAADAVGDRQDRPHFGEVRRAFLEPLDAAFEDAGDLVWLDLHWAQVLLTGTGLRVGLRGPGHLLSKSFQPVPDAGVEHHVAHAQHYAPEHVGVDLAAELDLAAGLALDPLADLVDQLLVELDRRGDRHRQQLVLLRPEDVELAPDPEERRQAVALGEQLEEVHEALVGPAHDLADAVLLLLRAEIRGEEEDLHVAVLGEGIGELADLVVNAVEHVVLERSVEQRA